MTVVAIVAVFGLVKMTGYALFTGNNWQGVQTNVAEHKVEGQLLALQMKAESTLKQQYGNDISIIWVKFIYKDTGVLGGIVLSADGSYDTQASEALYNILAAESPTTIKVIGAGGAFSALQAANGDVLLGVSPGTNTLQ